MARSAPARPCGAIAWRRGLDITHPVLHCPQAQGAPKDLDAKIDGVKGQIEKVVKQIKALPDNKELTTEQRVRKEELLREEKNLLWAEKNLHAAREGGRAAEASRRARDPPGASHAFLRGLA